MASSTKRAWRLQDFVAHASNVNCLALGHKSGRVLVTGGDDKKVNLWAVGKQNCIMSLSGHVSPVECVKFGHTEELVCAGSRHGALKVWDLEAVKIVKTLTGHKSSIRCIDFHPYGDFLTSGSLDTSIKLWDIRRKGCIFTYKGHRLSVNSIKFSPDGQWIASGGEDGIVKLWDIRAGRLLKELTDHGGPVTAVEFHPNEFLLASSSADKTVDFWELENFNLVSTTDRESTGIRCISFSESGEVLFAGAQDSLKVYGWEPARIYDSVPTGWSKIQDIAVTDQQLIGASYHASNVALFVVDLSRVQPFGGGPAANTNPFSHGQSFRKSFSRECPFTLPKTVDVRPTIEESDRSTDPEDENFFAEIQNVNDYKQIFQPNRILVRTPPPFPAPEEEDDPMVPQELRFTESSVHDPDSSPVTPYTTPPRSLELHSSTLLTSNPAPIESNTRMNENPPPGPQRSATTLEGSSDRRSHTRRKSISSKEDTTSADFMELDFPVKLSNLRHCPSEPSLNKNTHLHSSTTFSRNTQTRSTHAQNIKSDTLTKPQKTSRATSPSRSQYESNKSRRDVGISMQQQTQTTTTIQQRSIKTTSSARGPAASYARPTSPPTRPVPPQSLRIQKSPPPQTRRERNRLSESEMVNTSSPTEPEPIVPMCGDRPSGIDIEDFLPNHSRLLGYSTSMVNLSEAEALGSLSRQHDSMMTVLNVRHRSLQMAYQIWQSKGPVQAVESVLSMNDNAVLIDLLSSIQFNQPIWNLDLCSAILPRIIELIQSKYETYVQVACSTLRLILRNFTNLIKTNIQAPIQTVGVDISREERYNKCRKCYDNLLGIRSVLLKRQTVSGKLGKTFRELAILLEAID